MAEQNEREVDRYLAEHAMGWKPNTVRVIDGMGTVVTFHNSPFGFSDGNWTTEELEQYGGAPHFHADSVAVFGSGGLVEAMVKKGHRYTLLSGDNGGHRCWFLSPDGNKSYLEDGDTPARAVAHAAYAALTQNEPAARKEP